MPSENPNPQSRSHFIDELSALANLLGQTSELHVVPGKPGSGWCINLESGVITAEATDLDTRHPDFCRGLIVHEVGHALITRTQFFFPDSLKDHALFALLNSIEDIRLERYMSQCFAGTVPWCRLYNDELIRDTTPAAQRLYANDVVGAFILGMIFREWWGKLPDCIHPEAATAIDEVWPSLMRAVASHPTLMPPCDETPWRDAYASCDLGLVFEKPDSIEPPDIMEMTTRLAQMRTCQEIHMHILPVFERLLEKHGRNGEFLRSRYIQDLIAALESSTHDGRGSGIVHIKGRGKPKPRGTGSGGDVADDESARDEVAGRYNKACTHYNSEIDRLSRRLRDLLAVEGRLRIKGAYESGTRINLRRAIQGEADPRALSTVWQRAHAPKRPDPLVILQVDCSASMSGLNSEQSFRACVIVIEACQHVGVPISIIGFNSHATMLKHWNTNLGDGNREDLHPLVSPRGNTDMEHALTIAREHAEDARFKNVIHIIVSDGMPDFVPSCQENVGGLIALGQCVIGLGLGKGTEGLADIIPDAAVDLQPGDLPEILAARIESALGALYA